MVRAIDTILEPTLSDLLDDPIVRLVMASDGVTPADVRALATSVAARRRPVPDGPAMPRRDGAIRAAGRPFQAAGRGLGRALEACCGA